MSATLAVTGGRIFDGSTFVEDRALILEDGRIVAIAPAHQLPAGIAEIDATNRIVSPGFIDLQVNGGGGVLFNNDPTVAGIRTICSAHARFGTTALMATLITDTPEVGAAAISAGIEAHRLRVPGFLGLHLEGPHLSVARKGTHDPSLIRPMTDTDLARMVDAAGRFGKAITTIAPESVSPEQAARLVEAGYVVSLGHTDTKASTVAAYVAAGASMATHLFNAMSQMANREAGLVGAALASGRLSCGMIADGFHIDPTVMQVALRAKQGPGRIFLVTDAMSTIGTDQTSFELTGRQIYRKGGRLTLTDGTLAGADIDMLSCVLFVHKRLGLPLGEAINMASLYAAQAIGCASKGQLAAGMDADFLLLESDLSLAATYIGGTCVYRQSGQGQVAS
ncbi:N-acetylglucosamine-6-phosphate deacetylase [Pleomorphomonas sp. PLEO]|uniref:N-acetylglucosamine-6-phosphate deacetylase n=1 Tax=Pleomorphomonas sp. PLEO TaxID=3239306 RepID=UPI00351E8D40